MKPAIIFDLDGVIINSEKYWDEKEPAYLSRVFPEPIAKQIIGSTRGKSISLIYEQATKLGFTGSKEFFYKGYDELSVSIYSSGSLTPDIDNLLGRLVQRAVALGLVSSSPMPWINSVVMRLNHGRSFDYIESVNEHPNFRPKPAPDGYLAAMEKLGADRNNTLIVEDSQTGVDAAIASGAHVCCFTMHHSTKQIPHGAEIYANTSGELSTACLSFADRIIHLRER